MQTTRTESISTHLYTNHNIDSIISDMVCQCITNRRTFDGECLKISIHIWNSYKEFTIGHHDEPTMQELRPTGLLTYCI